MYYIVDTGLKKFFLYNEYEYEFFIRLAVFLTFLSKHFLHAHFIRISFSESVTRITITRGLYTMLFWILDPSTPVFCCIHVYVKYHIFAKPPIPYTSTTYKILSQTSWCKSMWKIYTLNMRAEIANYIENNLDSYKPCPRSDINNCLGV